MQIISGYLLHAYGLCGVEWLSSKSLLLGSSPLSTNQGKPRVYYSLYKKRGTESDSAGAFLFSDIPFYRCLSSLVLHPNCLIGALVLDTSLSSLLMKGPRPFTTFNRTGFPSGLRRISGSWPWVWITGIFPGILGEPSSSFLWDSSAISSSQAINLGSVHPWWSFLHSVQMRLWNIPNLPCGGPATRTLSKNLSMCRIPTSTSWVIGSWVFGWLHRYRGGTFKECFTTWCTETWTTPRYTKRDATQVDVGCAYPTSFYWCVLFSLCIETVPTQRQVILFARMVHPAWTHNLLVAYHKPMLMWMGAFPQNRDFH